MKKRGVKKGFKTGKAAKLRPVHKAKPAAKSSVKHVSVKHTSVRRRPESFIQREERAILREEQAVKKEVKREFRFLLSPEEFHVVTFVASLMILSFIFTSLSLIFYAVLTIAALAFAHFLREHHRPHDVLTILGIFFLPVAFTLAAFRDWLVLVLFGIYLVSAVSTVIIYYVHKKVHTPLKIMWQVTYSRIVAVTLALIVACLIPFILPDSFLSVFELIFVAVLPVAFVFFFMSKFLYIYFFDRKHIRHDLSRSLRHTMIYTLVFIVLLMCVYSIIAAMFYDSRDARYNENLDMALIGVTNVEKTMMSLPEDLADTIVAKDVAGFASSVKDEVAKEKSDVDVRELAFADILDDSYFGTLADNAVNVVRFVILEREMASMKSDLLRVYYSFSDSQREDAALEAYSSSLKSYVEGNFVAASQDPDVQEMIESLNDPDVTYSYFEENGFFYWFADSAGLTSVYHSDSMLGRQMSIIMRHSEPFRQLARLTLNLIVMFDSEAVSPSGIEYLYSHREADLLPMSSALRYTLIKESLDKRAENVADVGRVTFKVE